MKRRVPQNKMAALVRLVVVGGLLFFVGTLLWWAKNRPSYILSRIQNDIQNGNSAAAIVAYKSLLGSPSLTKADQVSYRLGLAEIYLDALGGRSTIVVLDGEKGYRPTPAFLTEAKEQVKAVLAVEPENAKANLLMARVHLSEGLDSFAIAELEKAVKNDGSNTGALVLLSSVYLDRGDALKAKTTALAAVAKETSDESRDALLQANAALGDIERALEEYGRLSSAYRNRSDIQARYVLLLTDANRWAEANSLSNHLFLQSPRNETVLLSRGTLFLKMQRLDEAAALFSELSTINPRSAWPYVRMADVFYKTGERPRLSAVRDILSEALPRWGETYYVRALAYLQEGDSVHALSSLKEATDVAPNLKEAIHLRAEILLASNQYGELGRTLRPLLDRAVYESYALTMLARSCFAQGKTGMAQELAREALQKAPYAAWPRMVLAGCDARNGRLKEASANAIDAVSLDPYDSHLIAAKDALFSASGGANESGLP